MYIADLHIHSNYSRATSKDCVPEYLDLWARKKGIQLIGSGDFTHPAWRQELKDKLIPAEEGLYLLNPSLKQEGAPDVAATRFVISGEISSIYKKHGKTRKVHNLILLPNLEAAEVLSKKLEAIGNIHSDGRPILGLDSRDLLEITLDTCPEAVFIPAHIWTPHFSLFGAFSGFDTIEECFEDLTPYIHAFETGLSSDPPMNWQISALDSLTMISNSDAHSPSKLGREANLLNTGLSYPELAAAIQQGAAAGFAGTLEFFPEEGKYHYDGHRNCGLRLSPDETEAYDGKCPVCGKKITIGVEHRVLQLADRPKGYRPANALPFESIIPLPEVISSSIGVSSSSKKVTDTYESLLHQLGTEFYILRECPLEEIRHVAGPCIEEGIRRLRTGQVECTPGFDGEYGKIQLLDASEIEKLNGQISFFPAHSPKKRNPAEKKPEKPCVDSRQQPQRQSNDRIPAKTPSVLDELNPAQKTAVLSNSAVTMVIAGPGTGKTKTLVSKIAELLSSGKAKPSEITAVTFTNKAAAELKERLEQQCGGKRALRSMTVGTFHSICLDLLIAQKKTCSLIDPIEALDLAEEVLTQQELPLSSQKFLQEVSKFKNGLPTEEAAFDTTAYDRYQDRLKQTGMLDFDDLLSEALSLCNEGKFLSKKRFSYLLVDEFQDINERQYQLVRAWGRWSKQIFVIGDPDQSIYGFRGSTPYCFERLAQDFSESQTIRLTDNYRSTPEILTTSLSVFPQDSDETRFLQAHREHGQPVRMFTAPNDFSEAVFVAKQINQLTGGIDMLDAQFFASDTIRSFSDIAILYRTNRQAQLLEKCLRKESIPYIVTGRDDFLAAPVVRGILSFFRFLCNPQEVHSLHLCLKLLWNCPEDLIARAQSCYSSCDFNDRERLTETSSELQGLGILPFFHQAVLDYLPLLKKETASAILERFVKEQGFPIKEDLSKLLHTAVFHHSIFDFLSALTLGRDSDIQRSGEKHYHAGAVTLMTLHSSKGLEFPVVFLCGVKKGVIPLESLHHTADLDEERRLFYVGMTRAKEELILITSPEPSAFLKQLSQDHLEAGQIPNRLHAREEKQLSLFD